MARPAAASLAAVLRMVGLADGADRRESALGGVGCGGRAREAGAARIHDAQRRRVPRARVRSPVGALCRARRAGGGGWRVGARGRSGEARLLPVPFAARIRTMAARLVITSVVRADPATHTPGSLDYARDDGTPVFRYTGAMFDNLQDKMDRVFKTLRGEA